MAFIRGRQNKYFFNWRFEMAEATLELLIYISSHISVCIQTISTSSSISVLVSGNNHPRLVYMFTLC